MHLILHMYFSGSRVILSLGFRVCNQVADIAFDIACVMKQMQEAMNT